MPLTSDQVTDGALLPPLTSILPTDLIPVRRPGSQTPLNVVQASILLPTAPVNVLAFELIGGGAFGHYDNNGGVGIVRNANAAVPALFANCYVLATIAAGATGQVYFFGYNTGAAPSIVTPAPNVFLSDVTPGGFLYAPPNVAGHIIQSLGPAILGLGVAYTFSPPVGPL